MSARDTLKNMRSRGYADATDSGASKKPDAPSTNRVIKLSDEEAKSLSGVEPGSDVACEVHGTVTADGQLRVMSVEPLDAEPTDEDNMASQVMNRMG